MNDLTQTFFPLPNGNRLLCYCLKYFALMFCFFFQKRKEKKLCLTVAKRAVCTADYEKENGEKDKERGTESGRDLRMNLSIMIHCLDLQITQSPKTAWPTLTHTHTHTDTCRHTHRHRKNASVHQKKEGRRG